MNNHAQSLSSVTGLYRIAKSLSCLLSAASETARLTVLPASLRLRYHSQIFQVSLKRVSSFAELRITMQMPSFKLERQPPAEGVCPVFTPCHPFSNRMFVFLQQLTIVFPGFYNSCRAYWCTLAFIIYLNLPLVTECLLIFIRSIAEEVFIAFASPCGFEKQVLFNLSTLAFAFIALINSCTQNTVCSLVRSRPSPKPSHAFFRLERYITNPKYSATAQAASLPEGSMTPQSRSCRVIQQLALRPAEVPTMLLAVAVTLILKSGCNKRTQRNRQPLDGLYGDDSSHDFGETGNLPFAVLSEPDMLLRLRIVQAPDASAQIQLSRRIPSDQTSSRLAGLFFSFDCTPERMYRGTLASDPGKACHLSLGREIFAFFRRMRRELIFLAFLGFSYVLRKDWVFDRAAVEAAILCVEGCWALICWEWKIIIGINSKLQVLIIWCQWNSKCGSSNSGKAFEDQGVRFGCGMGYSALRQTQNSLCVERKEHAVGFAGASYRNQVVQNQIANLLHQHQLPKSVVHRTVLERAGAQPSEIGCLQKQAAFRNGLPSEIGCLQKQAAFRNRLPSEIGQVMVIK